MGHIFAQLNTIRIQQSMYNWKVYENCVWLGKEAKGKTTCKQLPTSRICSGVIVYANIGIATLLVRSAISLGPKPLTSGVFLPACLVHYKSLTTSSVQYSRLLFNLMNKPAVMQI
jgi:hypothetical protein